MSLKDKISRSLKEAHFPFVGSMAMRNVMRRFVYIGRVMMPSWLTSTFYSPLEPPKEQESLLDIVISELTCPVCDAYMLRPINQCVNGHSMCDWCFEEVSSCPTCRAKKCFKSRSLALESVADEIVLPCRYKEHGCPHVGLGKDLRNHQEHCLFILQPCLFWYCRWFDCKHQLRRHLASAHEYNFYEAAKVTITGNNIFAHVYYRESNYSVIIYAYDEFFLLCWGVHYSGDTHWALFHLYHHYREKKKFSYKIVYHPIDPVPNETTVMVHRQLLNPGENKDMPILSRFRVDESVLNKYCGDDGVLKFTVSIFDAAHPEFSEKYCTKVEKFT